MPDTELSVTERAANVSLLASEVQAACLLLEAHGARGDTAAVEGCKQTLRAAIDALEGHLTALKEKAK